MKLTDNAIDLIKKRYLRANESSFSDIVSRVSKAIGKPSKKEKDYKHILESLDFLPNSPCLWNAGLSNYNKACFVLDIPDSIKGIFDTLSLSAQIFKSGGGVGYFFGNLREKNASLSDGGTSSGALSFLKIYNATTEEIKQGGIRRGASMGVMPYDHPEIWDFIDLKLRTNSITNFNLSILVDKKFMEAVETNGIIHTYSRKNPKNIVSSYKAKELFSVICYLAWRIGDPGIIFKDRVNEDNIYYPKEEIVCSNPCGEQFLFSGESCCLGSINLSQCVTKSGNFNKKKFIDLIRLQSFLQNSSIKNNLKEIG